MRISSCSCFLQILIVSFFADLLNTPLLESLNRNFYEVSPCIFNYERNTARSKSFSDLLRQTLLPLDPIDVRSFDALAKMYSDGTGYNSHRFVHYITDYVNVFYYKFSYIGRRSLFLYPETKPYGVCHGDDQQYIFDLGDLQAPYSGPTLIIPEDPENFMVERMTRIFENFASTG